MESELKIELLLQKYAGGRMPLLVDVDNPESGLVNPELLSVYQRGIFSKHSLQLGILLAARDHASLDSKWQKGDFGLNEWARPWSAFCETLRRTEEGEKACQECDRRRAIVVEGKNDVIAYLCDSGLIDFAAPISVKNQVIAILFCGQFKPKEGPIWNPEIVHRNGIFRPLAPGEPGVNAWAESLRRVQEIEQRVGLAAGTLLASWSDNVRPVQEISPEKGVEIQQVLRKAANQLSGLATSTYELEKEKIVDWILNHVTSSLAPLSTISAETIEVWRRLSSSLEYVSRYLGLDYALILSCCNKARDGFRILSLFGLPETNLSMGEKLSAAPTFLPTLQFMVCGLESPAPIILRDLKDLPLFDHLYHLHSRGKSKQALMVPIKIPMSSTSLLMILGDFKRNLDIDALSLDDRETLARMTEGITHVAGTMLLVEQLKETSKKQTRFLEDVAHDIRNPIQNIIAMAEYIELENIPVEAKQKKVKDIAAEARRINDLGQRVWILEDLEHGILDPKTYNLVSIFEVVMRCRKSLHHREVQNRVTVIVDGEIQKWPRIQLNEDLFYHTVLNLMDNAIKYSSPNAEVRIGGELRPLEYVLTFGNIGIGVPDSDKELIFQRHHRARNAELKVREGSGIGLSIVKAFADNHGSIEVESIPLKKSNLYLTIFRLKIRRE